MRLEEFTCYIYGYREKNINNVHFMMFKRKQAREHKVVDLSTLPPCKEVLSYHTRRANLVSYLWKNSLVSQLDYPDVINHGWNIDGTVHWLDEEFPKDIENILIEEVLDKMTDNEYGREVESEDNDSHEDT